MFLTVFVILLLTGLSVTTAQVNRSNSTDSQTPELPGRGGDRTATFDPWDAYFRPGVTAAQPAMVKIANVGFLSQLATGCPTGNMCCGLAAVNMATAYAYRVQPTADYLKKSYEYLGIGKCCGNGTNGDDQLRVAKAKTVGNCPNSFSAPITYTKLKEWLAQNVPVVVALRYSFISSKCSSWQGMHSFLVVGYDEKQSTWLVHDPLCASASSGAYRSIPSTQFRAAVDSYAEAVGRKDKDSVFAVVAQK